MRINIKPISVNEAWKGRRFKTDKYKRFERDCLLILPKGVVIPEGDLNISLEFGLSNFKLSDWDNPIKPFVDILQKKYDFNDSRIINGRVSKVKVKKGEEYINFEITKT